MKLVEFFFFKMIFFNFAEFQSVNKSILIFLFPVTSDSETFNKTLRIKVLRAPKSLLLVTLKTKVFEEKVN